MKKSTDSIGKILKTIKSKKSGETGVGVGIYANIDDNDIKAIIAATAKYCIYEIRERQEAASDEWDVGEILESTLDVLENELVMDSKPSKKIKSKPSGF